jgi:hypothetical protein
MLMRVPVACAVAWRFAFNVTHAVLRRFTQAFTTALLFVVKVAILALTILWTLQAIAWFIPAWFVWAFTIAYTLVV